MFQGFDDETVDFLWGIRFNNEKPWFEAHKQQYLDHLQRPMRELAGEVYESLRDACPEQGLVCRVSRIYRDARRLFGRGPYKDHLWFSIERPTEEWSHAPCFWFEIGPEEWGYGLGYYMALPATMRKLRHRMDTDPAPMEKLTASLRRQGEFSIEGQEYKRLPSPPASPALEPWYWKKNFSLTHTEKLSEDLFHRELVDRLIESYRFLLPHYRYFSTIDADPDPRDA